MPPGQQAEIPAKLSIVDLRSEPVPWRPLVKPLSCCRVALVTTAGVHLQGQEPFDVAAKEGDPSFRALPSSTPLDGYRITHTHYDHFDADRDVNCVFPISRIKEMAGSGQIGSMAETNYGFMGFIKDLEKLKENARILAQGLLEQGVDVVLGTPGWPLCHQSVGLVLREFEAAGLTTVGISLMPGITSRVLPPRTVSVHFPLGRVTGPPFGGGLQSAVVGAALKAAAQMAQPGAIERLPFEYPVEGGDRHE